MQEHYLQMNAEEFVQDDTQKQWEKIIYAF